MVDLLNDDKNILVAHNAEFDVNMLEKEGGHPRKVICTLKLARHIIVRPVTSNRRMIDYEV